MKEANAIRHLKNKARRNDLLAAFQLYETYSRNTASTQDQDTADLYLQQCHDLVQAAKKSITLDKVHLLNFRKFQDAEINFHPELTVLFGENGTGKTSILDAMSKQLDWLTGNIETENDEGGARITYHDINVDSDGHAEISTRFQLAGTGYINASLARSQQGTERRRRSSLTEIRTAADLFRIANNFKTLNLPLFAYYNAERFLGRPQFRFGPDSLKSIQALTRFDAYTGALKNDKPLVDFVEWMLYLDNLALASHGSVNSSEDTELKTALALLDRRRNKLERDAASPQDHESLNALKTTLKNLTAVATTLKSLQKRSADHIPAPRQPAWTGWIEHFLQPLIKGAENIWVDRSSGHAEVKITLNGTDLNINQLSHGQRAILILGGDIARRMAVLNPHMDNPLETSGIVGIDEIELHLHPKWQQRIIQALRHTFPNIQFIISTHSPQVLSTVSHHQIRHIRLGPGNRLRIETPTWQTKGASSELVLSMVMDTPPAAEDLDIVQRLHRLDQHIAEGSQDSPEAARLLEMLKKHYGSEHPVMIRVEGDLQFARMKQDVFPFKRDQ